MNLVTLDFETFFSDEYSLGGMTTEAYVRDPRFKAHMVGLTTGGYTNTHPTVSKGMHGMLEANAVLCHHAHFDGLILSHHYNIRPTFWFDTLSMARLVFPHAKSHSLEALAEMLGMGKKNIDYVSFKNIRDLPPDLYARIAAGCANDCEMTYAVFKAMLPYVPKDELRLIDLTIRMFTEPTLRLDVPRMQAYLKKTQLDKEALLLALKVEKADLQSNEKFASLLRGCGAEPPVKPSPSDPEKMIYAFAKTDEAMKELENHEDERVAMLVAARLGSKSTIGETRAQRLLDMDGRGPLCVYLKYCGAHTTRWSGGDSLNWQNFTRGSEMRKSIMAPKGYQLVVIDLAQIEFRMEMWLAGELSELEALREGKDVYCEAATSFYRRPITKADKIERQLFKTVLLGCGYGMGPDKFATVLKQQGLEGDAATLVGHYRATHPAVKRLWKYADKVLARLHIGAVDRDRVYYPWGPMMLDGAYIRLPNGATLDYSSLTFDGKDHAVTRRQGAVKMYGAKLVENVVQALSRVVLSQAMLKIAAARRIVMTCHDEVVYLAKTEEAQEALAEGLQIMKTPPAWALDLPLDAEGGYDVRYSK